MTLHVVAPMQSLVFLMLKIEWFVVNSALNLVELRYNSHVIGNVEQDLLLRVSPTKKGNSGPAWKYVQCKVTNAQLKWLAENLQPSNMRMLRDRTYAHVRAVTSGHFLATRLPQCAAVVHEGMMVAITPRVELTPVTELPTTTKKGRRKAA